MDSNAKRRSRVVLLVGIVLALIAGTATYIVASEAAARAPAEATDGTASLMVLLAAIAAFSDVPGRIGRACAARRRRPRP